MDAAITGLIGTLGGVALGAGTQALQAKRSRRWQVEDQGVRQLSQRQATLWQEQRVAYAALMTAMIDVINNYHHTQWLHSRLSQTAGAEHDQVIERFGEAGTGLAESVNKVLIVGEDVRLVARGSELRDAVNKFITVMSPLSPIRRSSSVGNPLDLNLTDELSSAYSRFADAARKELGVDD